MYCFQPTGRQRISPNSVLYALYARLDLTCLHRANLSKDLPASPAVMGARGAILAGLLAIVTCCAALPTPGVGYVNVPPTKGASGSASNARTTSERPHPENVLQNACPTPSPMRIELKDASGPQHNSVIPRRIALGAIVGLLVGGMPMASNAVQGSASGGKKEKPQNVQELMQKAASRAFGGGISGATAGVLQVLSLMWLRTTMNYQYRYGGTTTNALEKLWEQGGLPRFYQGIGFALLQQPLSRFGDTAANTGVVLLLDSLRETAGLPLFVKTAAASGAAALWRICLMPVDTFKTTMQVKGGDGVQMLKEKIKTQGIGCLYEGSLATVGSTFVGHYPWFVTFNTLQAMVPPADDGSLVSKLVRNAGIGLVASGISDCFSNSLRVVKTTKQTADVKASYVDTIKGILEQDGVQGLLGRGLYTRLITNGLQGMLFSVVWKLFDEYWKSQEKQ